MFRQLRWFIVTIVVYSILQANSVLGFEYKSTVKSDLIQTKNVFTKDNLLKVGLFSGVFLASMLLDRPVRGVVKHNQNTTLKHITDIANQFGNGLWTFPFVTGLHIVGRTTENEKLAEASFTAMEAFVIAGTVCILSKVVFGRARPSINDSPFTFKPFRGYKANWDSFPSEHVTIAWALVTPYAIYYHQPWLYLLPVSTAVARVYRDAHWFSDTILASGIGFSTAYMLSKWHITRKKKRITFVPLPQGIYLQMQF